MDIPQFCIQRFNLDPKTRKVNLTPFDSKTYQPMGEPGIPGYFVVSTAPPNIEDEVDFDRADWEETRRGIDAIATDLYQIYCTFPTAPEVVIVIHGYNTREEGIKVWYQDIFRYINQTDPVISQKRNVVFIGYRWSSETLVLTPASLWSHFWALPPAPKALLTFGTLCSIAWLVLGWFELRTWVDLLLGGLLWLSASAAALVTGLIFLRISGYFRDVYRATNFGVLDLVELLRRVDKALIDTTVMALHRQDRSNQDVTQAAHQQWNTSNKKVKLTFIGHSMGALVVTNVVRILSDVFDTRSVAKQPPSDIGRTLRLERLILAAPDIPVLSIISSRANFLASSLRRFSETYLFSNEGDLALRFASTAANYISFPSATRTRGYRLGNVAITHFKDYGISNLKNLRHYFLPRHRLKDAMQADPEDILQNLYVTHSWGPGDGYLSLAELFAQQDKGQSSLVTLADLFTVFDCTDYRDHGVKLKEGNYRPRKSGILSRAKYKKNLNYWDYLELVVDSVFGRRDVHGGYFQGEFSRQLIYRLAFLGFEGVLKTYAETPQVALDGLHQDCFQRGIQAYLSPLRYRVNVQGQPVQEAKAELLRTIRQKQ